MDGRIDRMAGIANILFVIAADEQVTIIVGQIKWYEMCLENYYYYDDDDDSGHRWTTDMDGWMLCVRMFEKDVEIALYKSVSPLLPLRLFVLLLYHPRSPDKPPLLTLKCDHHHVS